MTTPSLLELCPIDLDALAGFEGRIVVFVGADGKLDPIARRIDRLTRGALVRFAASDAFGKMKPAESCDLAFPSGLAADAVQVVRLERRVGPDLSRRAGGAIGKAMNGKPVLILGGKRRGLEDVVLGAGLRAYSFDACKSGDAPSIPGPITLMVSDPEALAPALDLVRATMEGVFFTRDLVNLPSNILTTTDFADRLAQMTDLGLTVEVLEEDQLRELGMGMLLGVGMGSETPTKVVVMHWNGGGDEQPLALIGKGVVFDTGGISIKPAGGMEDMTMDMGGAGVVSGVMRTLALRKAKANVVGLVGLVENMPDGRAQRPGDVVTSMKGDTVEVINTDAEGRLVLGDVMWYAQERFNPVGMIDLATLTGAIIVALGHEHAGVFSNNDAFADSFLKAAKMTGEGAWRMPIGDAYAKMLKSQVADVKNVGTRAGGSITAAEFLHRFVKEETPWMHLDIAGVTQPVGEIPLAPKGASGWGVRALDQLIRNAYETREDAPDAVQDAGEV